MFWKIGFGIELILIVVMAFVFIKASPMKNQGAISWGEIYSNNSVETTRFMSELFDFKNTGENDQRLSPNVDVRELTGNDDVPHSVMYFTVTDYNAIHKKIIEMGATPVAIYKYTHGARFGIYKIPGGINIGIVQWEHVKNKQ